MDHQKRDSELKSETPEDLGLEANTSDFDESISAADGDSALAKANEFFESCRWIEGSEVMAIFIALRNSTTVHPFFLVSEGEINLICDLLSEEVLEGCEEDDVCTACGVLKESLIKKLNVMTRENRWGLVLHLQAATKINIVERCDFLVSRRFELCSTPESHTQLIDELLLIALVA